MAVLTKMKHPATKPIVNGMGARRAHAEPVWGQPGSNPERVPTGRLGGVPLSPLPPSTKRTLPPGAVPIPGTPPAAATPAAKAKLTGTANALTRGKGKKLGLKKQPGPSPKPPVKGRPAPVKRPKGKTILHKSTSTKLAPAAKKRWPGLSST